MSIGQSPRLSVSNVKNKNYNDFQNKNEQHTPISQKQVSYKNGQNQKNYDASTNSEIISVNNTNDTNSSSATNNVISTSTFDDVVDSLGTISQQQILSKSKDEAQYESADFDLFFEKLFKQKLLSKVFHKWNKMVLPLHPLNQISFAYQRKNMNKKKRLYFYRWYNRFLKRQKTLKLSISYQHAENIQLRPIKSSNEKNIELLEQTQKMTEEISILQAKKEEKEQSTHSFRQALEESIKNENKIKHILSRLCQEKKSILEQISQSESKYEDNLVQFMLDTQMKKDKSDEKLQKLQMENAQKDRELIALKKYIESNEIMHQKEVDDLKKKLNSAFEVTNGFRMEISRLKDSTPPIKQKSQIDVISPTALIDQLVQ